MVDITNLISNVQPAQVQVPVSPVPEALARLGEVTGDAARLLAQAESRRQNALDQAEADRLYTSTAASIDRRNSLRESVPNPRTHRANVMGDTDKLINDTLDVATNDEVRARLRDRFNELTLATYKHASQFENRLVVDEGKAALEGNLATLASQASAEDDPRERAKLIAEGEAAIGRGTIAGFHGSDDGEKRNRAFRRETQRNYGKRIAFDDPLLGYRMLAHNEIQFDNEVDRLAFRLDLDQRVAQLDAAEARADRRLTKETKDSATRTATDFILRLDPTGDPAQRPSVSDVDQFLRDFAPHIEEGVKNTLIDLSRKPVREGGISNPETYNQIAMGIVGGAPSLTPNSVLRLAGKGLSAKDAAFLADKLNQHQRTDDLSQSPAYRLHRDRIVIQFRGTTFIDPALGFFMAPDKAQRFQAALLEFDRLARRTPDQMEKIADAIVEREFKLGGALPTIKPRETKP